MTCCRVLRRRVGHVLVRRPCRSPVAVSWHLPGHEQRSRHDFCRAHADTLTTQCEVWCLTCGSIQSLRYSTPLRLSACDLCLRHIHSTLDQGLRGERQHRLAAREQDKTRRRATQVQFKAAMTLRWLYAWGLHSVDCLTIVMDYATDAHLRAFVDVAAGLQS